LRLLHSRFIRHLHRCACPDRGLIEWAESPPPVAEQFERLVVMAVHGAAVCDVGGARCPSRSTRWRLERIHVIEPIVW